MSSARLLRLGDRDDAVRELQERLADAGYPVIDEPGSYAADTERAVRAFQGERQLRVDGICGPQTWGALVESAYELGDRLLYTRTPMLRGDDVVDLQHRLNAMGFDAGREDGIFGPATERALRQFQRDAGLATDGVCGPATRAHLDRVGRLAAGSVATVRERDDLARSSRRLTGQRIFVAVEPGLDVLGRALAAELASVGAETVLDVSGVADPTLAEAANDSAADVFLAVRSTDGPLEGRCVFFEHRRYRSEAGHAVARRVDEELAGILGPARGPVGRADTVLRETRMAAVLCEVAVRGDVTSMAVVVTRAGELARAIARGLRRGVEEPVDVEDARG
ncbi:MAG TPA: peptidoglycan-binding protein [Acidimicrobiia bacterium]|nr:peptidoglycan-binding protein [Acidimicrobiia bacterium]